MNSPVPLNDTHHITFSETEIQNLFGHEAAEDEDIDRLKGYYFKSDIYDRVVNDLPLRILVGHKGIGKSALFQVAMAEQNDQGKLAILIKPDDIVGLTTDTSDFLKTIREWKLSLVDIIANKACSHFEGAAEFDKDLPSPSKGIGLIDWLSKTFKVIGDRIDLTVSKRKILDQFLQKKEIYIYIDDLDRGWQGRKEDITRISALLNAARDISNENRGVCFRISLRSDVYFLVRTSDESTDKIEGSVVWHTWENHQIFLLLIKRIERFFGRNFDDFALRNVQQKQLAQYLDPIMDPRFHGRGRWANVPTYRVLMSLIRRRPRDLVKICTLAARKAHKDQASKIMTKHLQESFEEYSQGRLQDTINEFRSELPHIDRLLMGMKPNKNEREAKSGYLYKTDALLRKINNVEQSGKFEFAGRRTASTKDLAAFLYKINFLTARKETSTEIIRKYFEENRYLQSAFADFGFDWEMHLAYRWALQPDNVMDILDSYKLSESE